MPIRLSGLASGLDTDALIKGIMDAERLKNKRVTDKKTTLEWQQDKWKELNAKLYKLYADDLSKLRMQGNYATKKVTSSHENLVSVEGKSNATNGAHVISGIILASSQFVTGESIGKGESGKSNLTDLGVDNGTQVTIKANGKEVILDVRSDTTIDDFVQKLKDAGLNASFDADQGRFFISSKNSGVEGQFTIETSADTGIGSKRAIDDAVGYGSLSKANKAKVDAAYQVLRGADETTLAKALESAEIDESADDEATKSIKKAVATLQDLTEAKVTREARAIAVPRVREGIRNAIEKGEEYEGIDYSETYDLIKKAAMEELKAKYGGDEPDLEDEEIKKELNQLIDKHFDARVSSSMNTEEAKEIILEKTNKIVEEGTTLPSQIEGEDDTKIPKLSDVINDLKNDIRVYAGGNINGTSGKLSGLGLSEISEGVDEKGNKIVESSGDVSIIQAADSQVTYNGAIIEGTSNVITVNGLTITLKGQLNPGETVTLNVSNDTEASYNMIKDFVTSFNDILKEMNDLFYAPSSKGYAPLSDDEMGMMTDKQIEKWESTIQNSVLRRDSTLGSIIDVMKRTVMGSVDIGGKNFSLSSIGIGTSKDYTEKGLLHINGDKDDPAFRDVSDVLMKMLEEDPDTVIEGFSKITGNLYNAMADKMKSIPNVRSAFTFYNDKTMDKRIDQYTKDVSALEKKLKAVENKYYKQFAAMETAMSKLQSQSNALAGMLGMGN